jgi:hypothetical protein
MHVHEFIEGLCERHRMSACALRPAAAPPLAEASPLRLTPDLAVSVPVVGRLLPTLFARGAPALLPATHSAVLSACTVRYWARLGGCTDVVLPSRA